jgi:hypothetical protein
MGIFSDSRHLPASSLISWPLRSSAHRNQIKLSVDVYNKSSSSDFLLISSSWILGFAYGRLEVAPESRKILPQDPGGKILYLPSFLCL